MARRLAEAGLSLTRVASAGLAVSQAAVSPDDARSTARLFGVSLDHHVPSPLTSTLVRDSDLIVVMEPGQRRAVRRAYPEAAGRVYLLSLFDKAAWGYGRYSIDDPFMLGPNEFLYCYRRIERAVDGLLVPILAATTMPLAASRSSAAEGRFSGEEARVDHRKG